MLHCIDIETARISDENPCPRVVCVSHYQDNMFTPRLYPTPDAKKPLTEILSDPSSKIVGHNIAFDLTCIAFTWPELLPLIFKKYDNLQVDCTEERERLYSIARGTYKDEGSKRGLFSLATLCDQRLGIQVEGKGDTQLSYGPLENQPLSAYTADQIEYAKNDALYTWQLYAEQTARWLKKIGEKGLDNSPYQARRSFCARLASIAGIGANAERVEALAKTLSEKHAELRPLMQQAGLVRWKDGKLKKSLAKIRNMVVAAYEDVPLSDKGNVQTDRATLENSGHPFLIAMAEYQHLDKLLNNDVEALKKACTFRRHAYFRLLNSGRVQASNPNFQNVPTRWGIRECYEPASGNVFVDCDYLGVELHTWAQECLWLFGFSALADALNAGLDAHLEMARNLVGGISYEEALRRKEAGDKAILDARRRAKMANFGLMGGMGPSQFSRHSTLSFGYPMPETEAAHVRNIWMQTWPEAPLYLKYVSDDIGGFGRRTTVVQPVSGRIRGNCGYTDAANTRFQGLAADGMIYAWWLIAKACYVDRDSPLYGSRVVMPIHDQFILESPEERGHECAMELSRLMCEGMEAYTPDVKIKAEPVITDRWYKDARQVWKNGRLQTYKGE